MSTTGKLWIVGLGPGARSALTPQALAALERAEVIVGYAGYFDWLDGLTNGKECLRLPLGQEKERARRALAHAVEGRAVCVISSGDPGVYGMASAVLEALEELERDRQPEVEVVPGVSAVTACAALLGAPLGHDFAVVSLSDLLTPWEIIEKRLGSAAAADFIVAILNPRSERRDWQLGRAQGILLRHRAPETPVGIVRNAYRPGQTVAITTLGSLHEAEVDMFTTVIVGNSQTRRFGPRLVTPRESSPPPLWGRVRVGGSSLPPRAVTHGAPIEGEGDAILAESFRIIDAEIGAHRFSAAEWPIVRRMIHAAGDLELAPLVQFHRDAALAGVRVLRERTPIVTDVRMVALGINKGARSLLDVDVHCFIDDPVVERAAREKGQTRSARALEKAIAEVGDAIYVIGNAPTALRTLCAATRRGAVRPRLILAMPVGFVSVVESKEQALALDVPVISVRGRRGGSALAVAAINALLLRAAEEGKP